MLYSPWDCKLLKAIDTIKAGLYTTREAVQIFWAARFGPFYLCTFRAPPSFLKIVYGTDSNDAFRGCWRPREGGNGLWQGNWKSMKLQYREETVIADVTAITCRFRKSGCKVPGWGSLALSWVRYWTSNAKKESLSSQNNSKKKAVPGGYRTKSIGDISLNYIV